MPRQFGPSMHRAGRPNPLDDCRLPCLARLVDLAQPGRDRDDRLRAHRECCVDRLLERGGGQRHDDELRRARELGERSERGCPRISPPLRLTSQTSRRCGAPQSALRDPLAPFGGVVRGTEHGDRPGLEEGPQVAHAASLRESLDRAVRTRGTPPRFVASRDLPSSQRPAFAVTDARSEKEATSPQTSSSRSTREPPRAGRHSSMPPGAVLPSGSCRITNTTRCPGSSSTIRSSCSMLSAPARERCSPRSTLEPRCRRRDHEPTRDDRRLGARHRASDRERDRLAGHPDRDRCAELIASGAAELVHARTGLPVQPYFSATKLALAARQRRRAPASKPRGSARGRNDRELARLESHGRSRRRRAL